MPSAFLGMRLAKVATVEFSLIFEYSTELQVVRNLDMCGLSQGWEIEKAPVQPQSETPRMALWNIGTMFVSHSVTDFAICRGHRMILVVVLK